MKILRLKEVLSITGLSKTSIYDFVADGSFPMSVQLGARSVGWIESEIDDWINKKIEQRNKLASKVSRNN